MLSAHVWLTHMDSGVLCTVFLPVSCDLPVGLVVFRGTLADTLIILFFAGFVHCLFQLFSP